MAAARTVWFSFHLGCHRSAVSLSALNVSPLTQMPQCGNWTPASVPPPTEGRSNPTNCLLFPPSSFILRSFVWVYIFFSAGEVLLSTLSCCSPYTSVSEGVFLMYRGERCIPHPPTPPPSCSSSLPALLRCTCHITLYKFKMHNMLICCTHIAKWLPPQC